MVKDGLNIVETFLHLASIYSSQLLKVRHAASRTDLTERKLG